ncbi:MAG TPA: PBSX family phage terminase large subunit [Clostridiales bacterium]|nr:PBSX family phage terminase large subunit [Clostridiales bacterium]
MRIERFSEKQMMVLNWWCSGSPYRDLDGIICDGAVRSGKSLCMFLSFIFWAFYRFEGQSFAICGRTLNSVRRNLFNPMLPLLEELGFRCRVISSKGLLEITKGSRRNRFYYFGGKDESSAAAIQGMTLCGVLFDEVVLMPRSFVEQALARCSVEGSKFWFNCNPSYPSHWFYTEWIRKAKEKRVLYLHFRMEENPSLSRRIINRYKSLYSGAFYERFVEGRWVCAEGLVYPMFDPASVCEVPENCERYYISCDYGTVNPSSFGLWGQKEGVWYRIGEYYYDSRRQGGQKTDEEYYRELKKLAGGRKIEAVVCDPSAASFMACIRSHGEFKVIPARNDLLDGIRIVGGMLKSGKIKICKPCRDAIREFSLYRWDEGAGKDVPKKENDHAMDDIRYFAATVAAKSFVPAVAAVDRGCKF